MSRTADTIGSGLMFWVWPDELLTQLGTTPSGQSIATINEQAGGSSWGQPTTAQQPLWQPGPGNGLTESWLEFEPAGSGMGMDRASNLSDATGQVTIMAIALIPSDTSANYAKVLSGDVGGFDCYRNQSTVTQQLDKAGAVSIGASSVITPSGALGTWHILTITYDGTTAKFYDNSGLLNSVTNVQSISGSHAYAIGYSVGGGFAAQTYVAEVAVWDNVLLSTDLENARSGMSDRSGVTISDYVPASGGLPIIVGFRPVIAQQAVQRASFY